MFAKALGAEIVAVISRSTARKADAQKMGADVFVSPPTRKINTVFNRFESLQHVFTNTRMHVLLLLWHAALCIKMYERGMLTLRFWELDSHRRRTGLAESARKVPGLDRVHGERSKYAARRLSQVAKTAWSIDSDRCH